MSIITPEVYSYKDTDPLVVYGEAVVSKGLYVRSAINGYGLITRGLVWQLYDIWISSGPLVSLVTNWVASASQSVTTTWSTSSSQSVTTTWARSQGGIFGDYQN